MNLRLSGACHGESSLFLSKGVVEKPQISGLFKNAQMQGAQKANREAYIYIR